MRRNDAIERLKQHRTELAALGVTHAYLFGSVARDTAAPGSDVDIMVDLDEGPGGCKPLFSAFDFGRIQFALTQILGLPVDLVVRKDAMRPGARLQKVAAETVVSVF